MTILSIMANRAWPNIETFILVILVRDSRSLDVRMMQWYLGFYAYTNRDRARTMKAANGAVELELKKPIHLTGCDNRRQRYLTIIRWVGYLGRHGRTSWLTRALSVGRRYGLAVCTLVEEPTQSLAVGLPDPQEGRLVDWWCWYFHSR